MKKILLKITTVATVTMMTSLSAHALTMCAANWLESGWRNSHPEILENAYTTYTIQGPHGTWAVSSTRGGMGRQSISGISQCTTVAGAYGSARSANFASGDAGAAGGPNCWCRMTAPQVGVLWVAFGSLGTTGNVTCVGNCAQHCASVVIYDPPLRLSILSVL